MADLYGPATDLAGDIGVVDALKAPVYVLYRPQDFPSRAPWAKLEADSSDFERVYLENGYRVYRGRR